MLAKILKGNQNFIPIFIILLWAVLFFFLNGIDTTNTSALISGALTLIIVTSVTLIIDNFPYFKENYFFSFLFAISTLLLICCLDDLSFFAGLFFVFVVILQIVFKNHYEFSIFNAFDLGFFMGFAVLFYPPFWVFGVFLILHYVFLGKTQILNLILSILGLLTFTILFFELIAVFDYWHIWESMKEQFYFDFLSLDLKYLFLLPLLIPFSLGIMDYFANINRQPVEKKRVFLDAFLLLSIALAYVILYGEANQNALLFMLFPVTLLSTNYISYSKVFWRKEVLLWLFVVVFLLFRFHSYIEIPAFFERVTF